jgi:glycosyltransferase involved in cell wall biosynthesis
MLDFESRNGTVGAADSETVEKGRREILEQARSQKLKVKPQGRPRLDVPPTPTAEGGEQAPALALFCFEEPESAVGRFVANLAGALARRKLGVHVFTRRAFEAAPAVSVHTVGDGPEGDLPAQVQEFTHRASNAFLKQFEATAAPVTLLGAEWSSFPTLSLLRSLKDLPTLLSLHSLERQRSNLTSEVSRYIEEIELAGLRGARAVLLQDPATAEVAKYWAPECADRLVTARQPFPVAPFATNVDPGAVKARYQVGPVDPMILYVGDLNERYGPDLLLKAMPGILKNNKQARLVVAGDGDQYWRLRVFARYLLLEHAVRLAGSVEGQAAYELIQAADVVVVPSRETTPWWPIQAAWAARRPVVATHNAAPGLVEHGQDALLVYPSENSLVWGIEHVLFQPEVARELGRKGHEKLEERFGWNGVAAQVEELLATPVAR